ncbi:14605_t:CDS:2 [Dentiscutata heterogama]|uniref:14605_t:CDS:1 n=1 Tax=Dentiscutata heterogama TaxID=1316150 RepID=A0ACA9L7J8_9GLOM|nr:14605_t:CDS:2 [Dentiscutata heterogama]
MDIDKHVNEIECEGRNDIPQKKINIAKAPTDSQQKLKLYALFKSPLLKNPSNKKSQKPLYENQPTNQNINPHQDQSNLQIQSQTQNHSNV